LELRNAEINKEADSSAVRARRQTSVAVAVALLIILTLGGWLRFRGLDWDSSYHLHPDERFLTIVTSELEGVDSLKSYLASSESSLNPYNRGHGFFVYGNLPITLTSYAGLAAQRLCSTFLDSCRHNYQTYDGIHLVGRFLSALADILTILFTYLIGRLLYGRRAGLIAAFFMATAALAIQQSHFYTVDSWAAFFAAFTLYAAVKAADFRRSAPRIRWMWWALVGIGVGLAASARINMLPLAIVAPLAALASYRASGEREAAGALAGSIGRHLLRMTAPLALAAILSLVLFRVAQPYAFADPFQPMETGSELFLGISNDSLPSWFRFDPRWLSNMEEIQRHQSPEASSPPAIQWTGRSPILFPLSNLVLYGAGIGASLFAILGTLWGLNRIVGLGESWRRLLIPLGWLIVYFGYMGTRWTKSMRYFLPIYSALFLMAGWVILVLWKRTEGSRFRRTLTAGGVALALLISLLWSISFSSIYTRPVTREAASEWMFENVPSAVSIDFESNGLTRHLQLPAGSGYLAAGAAPKILPFRAEGDWLLSGLSLNYVSAGQEGSDLSSAQSILFEIWETTADELVIQDELTVEAGLERARLAAELNTQLQAGGQYHLIIHPPERGDILLGTSVIANEHWDDPLPLRYQGRDPYWNYYVGYGAGQIPVAHPDSAVKLEQMNEWLEASDYIVLSSQRAMWSLPRIPQTYPLMVRYYEALFSGELGFQLVSSFSADLNIGPLRVNDVAGQFAFAAIDDFGWPPPNELAAEEAFSVYDHPPVWIFEKSPGFDSKSARSALSTIAVREATFLTPGQATAAPNGLMLSNEAADNQLHSGTFAKLFDAPQRLLSMPLLLALTWWLALSLLGWIVYPILFTSMSGLSDRGFAFTRLLALLLVAYLAWIGASSGLMLFNRGSIAIALVFLLATSAFVAIKNGAAILATLRRNLPLLLTTEALGLILFVAFMAIRLGNPDAWDVIWGGEKPMNLSYFTAVMKSATFPPYDPWFAGGYINYYYFGYVIFGTFTKLLGIPPIIAYNLLKTAAGGNIAVGPVLLGAAKPVHILTASTTVRRIVNMTALTVADANATR